MEPTLSTQFHTKERKRSKRDKDEHQSKKRHLDTDAQGDGDRKHKRSKSSAPISEDDDFATKARSIGHSPSKGRASIDGDAAEMAASEVKRQRKRGKKEKRRRKEESQWGASNEPTETGADTLKAQLAKQSGIQQTTEDAMDDFAPTAKSSVGTLENPLDQHCPFFTQRVSQYVPLFPLGLIDPIEGYIDQHLKPLLNHYVPALRGVLLGYHNVEIGEAPGRGSITQKSQISDTALLESIDEYAVTYAWLTAKVDLFKPTRGAWLEGSVNLQTEGHLGVVCWGMFNAAIEAARLPQGWEWVSTLGQEPQADEDRQETFEEGNQDVGEHEEGHTQVHSTGYWVDGDRARVRGVVRFQIKNFEVGVGGDYGYLSIEGTMLEAETEKRMVAEEMEKTRRWRQQTGSTSKGQKRIPDFSMTKFGLDEEQEDQSSRYEIWKGSRPGSETAE